MSLMLTSVDTVDKFDCVYGNMKMLTKRHPVISLFINNEHLSKTCITATKTIIITLII